MKAQDTPAPEPVRVTPVPDSVRLAAVVHVDMVGYSRLMGLDEASTVARLRAVRDGLLRPMVAQAGGRVVNTAGDSALIVFRGTIMAVRFALSFQRALAAREAAESTDRIIRYRVGVTVADVLSDGAEVHGEGVNVATRLQAACPPGSVCVSRAVCDQVRDKVNADFEPLGFLALKNIGRPVEAYVMRPHGSDAIGVRQAVETWRVQTPALRRGWGVVVGTALLASGVAGWVTVSPGPLAIDARQALTALPSMGMRHAPELSLVVLPFATFSGNAAQDEFANAIADDLTTDLSRLGNVVVIGYSWAQASHHIANAQWVGGKLGVRYVVQGNVRRLETGMVRVNAQLVLAESGRIVWAERFDREMRPPGKEQSDIVQRISIALSTRLMHEEGARDQQ